MSDDGRSDGDRSDSDRSDGEDRSDDTPGDRLFQGGPGDETDESDEAPDPDDADDPFAALGDEGADEAGPDPSPHAGPEPGRPDDDPFADLDADAGDATTGGDPFESMEVGDVGEEDVWEALDEETSVGADAADSSEFDAGSAGDAATRPGGPIGGAAPTDDERVVDKRSYCQQCPHFSAPPETACTHEGTDIVESVDFSRFRVRNCPMVDGEDPAFDAE